MVRPSIPTTKWSSMGESLARIVHLALAVAERIKTNMQTRLAIEIARVQLARKAVSRRFHGGENESSPYTAREKRCRSLR